MQKRASGATGSPQDGQRSWSGDPQFMQKRAPSGFSDEQLPHTTPGITVSR
jgi:hypothetical protein